MKNTESCPRVNKTKRKHYSILKRKLSPPQKSEIRIKLFGNKEGLEEITDQI